MSLNVVLVLIAVVAIVAFLWFILAPPRRTVIDGFRLSRSMERMRQYAIIQHMAVGCTYSEHPFVFHLDMVAAQLIRFGHTSEVEIQCAYGHDICEDTPTTVDEVRAFAGQAVGDHVDALTDVKYGPDGKLLGNRRARQTLTYEKTRGYAKIHGDSVINDKLADRLANMLYSIEARTAHVGMYADENDWFRGSLMPSGGDPTMWEECDRLAMWCSVVRDEIKQEKKNRRRQELLEQGAV